MARLAKQATLVSHEEVLALEHRLYGEKTDTDRRDQPGSSIKLLEHTDAVIALEAGVMNLGPRDSIMMGLTLYRRAAIPPCPEGWVRFSSAEHDPGGTYPGIESWSSFRLSAPRSSPTGSVDSLARAAIRTLESMRSCDIEAHRSAITAPWCWVTPRRVAVVPGVIRARVSSGQDITMTMMASGLPKGRHRFCVYSSYGRVSNDGDESTPGRWTRAP